MGEKKSKKVRAAWLENSEGVWSPIVQYMPTETYLLSISFSSDHTEFCLVFFSPYAQSLTFAFFISSCTSVFFAQKITVVFFRMNFLMMNSVFCLFV